MRPAAALLVALLHAAAAAGPAAAQLSDNSSNATASALSTSSAAAAAGDVSSAQSLWTLSDAKCLRSCVTVADSPLSWCAEQVTYARFCNRTAAGDASWSVSQLEEAAQAAYAAIVFGLSTPPTDACKVYLHKWVCWQFFTQCAADKVTLRPVCASSCATLADVCVIGWLDCDVEVEEHRGTAPPWWYDESGAYIRGVKPANSSIPVADRRSVTLETGGVLGQGRLYAAPGERCTGGSRRAAGAPAWLLLLTLACVSAALPTPQQPRTRDWPFAGAHF